MKRIVLICIFLLLCSSCTNEVSHVTCAGDYIIVYYRAGDAVAKKTEEGVENLGVHPGGGYHLRVSPVAYKEAIHCYDLWKAKNEKDTETETE